uniref:Uncharacterized protein n=1 Tax=Arundo donax TaxID=35708 RepID=A0A0A9DYS0_ARUDO
MFLPLVFPSHNLINAQAEMMHGAKGCERSMVWTRASSPTTLQTQVGTSKMARLRLKKGVVAP